MSGLLDPGSGIRDEKIRIRDKHPGSATLIFTLNLPFCWVPVSFQHLYLFHPLILPWRRMLGLIPGLSLNSHCEPVCLIQNYSRRNFFLQISSKTRLLLIQDATSYPLIRLHLIHYGAASHPPMAAYRSFITTSHPPLNFTSHPVFILQHRSWRFMVGAVISPKSMAGV